MALTAILRGMQNAATAIHNNFTELELLLKDVPVLWEGASFLSGTHTINLSKSIKDCPKGIVVKFNPYNSSAGTAYTSQSSYYFIPKQHVLGNASGQNTFAPIFKQDGTLIGAKVFTVSPIQLKGADVNAVGALYGYVLTGVYGV